MLRDAGWQINDKRVERLWRREGLKVPMKQPKKGRLWLNDGSCVRLRPEHRNHVWSYDFVHWRTDDGKPFRTLNIIDEYSRECLAIRVDRKLNSGSVIDALSDLFILHGIASFIRSDNGPEFVAQAGQDWIKAVGAKIAYSAGTARSLQGFDPDGRFQDCGHEDAGSQRRPRRRRCRRPGATADKRLPQRRDLPQQWRRSQLHRSKMDFFSSLLEYPL